MSEAEEKAEDRSISGEWVTVAEAARRLGIAPRQARRYADRLGDRDRDTRGTSSGQSLLYVRFAAVEALRAESDQRRREQGHGPKDRDRTGEDSPRDRPQDTAGTVSEGILPAAAYQRVIAEQSARIDDMRARLDQADRREGELLAALRQAQENLQREQSLRLLSAPAAEALPEAEKEAPPAEAPADQRIYGLGASAPGPPAETARAAGEKPGSVLQKLLRWLRS